MTSKERAEQLAKQYLRRDCYGKPYGDHNHICQVCSLVAVIQPALDAVVQEERLAMTQRIREVVVQELPGADTTLERILATSVGWSRFQDGISASASGVRPRSSRCIRNARPVNSVCGGDDEHR